jgi:hypothetical protein
MWRMRNASPTKNFRRGGVSREKIQEGKMGKKRVIRDGGWWDKWVQEDEVHSSKGESKALH